MAEKKFHVKYIDLTTGRTEEEMIPEKEQYDLYKRQREGKISIIEIHSVTERMTQTSEPLLFRRFRKRLKERREKPRASKQEETSLTHDSVPKKSEPNPESGRTFQDQSDEAYCLECVEGHTMAGLTEMRHAIDRHRTAGKMTEGVTEKVRVAIGELTGINEDVRSTKDASPEVKKGLEEILDEVRWIRKEYGMSGKGLTRGYGNLEDLEELRNRIFLMQSKAYALVEQCPTCKPHIQTTMGKAVEERIRSG